MKTIISENIYVASTSPIFTNYGGGRYDTGQIIVKNFLVKPVIGEVEDGSKRTIGYVEAVTGDRVIDTHYFPISFAGGFDYDNPDTQYQIDYVCQNDGVGDVAWTVNARIPANKMMGQSGVDRYLAKDPEEIRADLLMVRTSCREMAKTEEPEDEMGMY